MKKWITVFMTASLLCTIRLGFGQFYDFSDQQLPALWYGQKSHFTISPNGMLQLQAPSGSNSSYLSWKTPDHTNSFWEFYIQYNFAASASNYAEMYVLSLLQDPTAVGNISYYLKIGGETGNEDRIQLFYQHGTQKTNVLESRLVQTGTALALHIRLWRGPNGYWTLYTDHTASQLFQKEASGVHQSRTDFPYCALRCIYSASRSNKFFFDNIYSDHPFAVHEYAFEDPTTLHITFTLPIAKSTSYTVSATSLSLYETSLQGAILTLRFSSAVETGMYTIQFNELLSAAGDTLFDRIQIIEKKAVFYTGQLRITELLADPTPSYGLPELEFVELSNRSSLPVQLSDFNLHDPGVQCTLPSYVLLPDSCIILCPKNGCPQYTRTNCLELPIFPNLNNESDSVSVLAKDSTLIDAFYYSLSNLPNDERKNGGYSIIRMVMPFECIINQTFTYSTAPSGGTPGIHTPGPIDYMIQVETQQLTDSTFVLKSNQYGTLDNRSISLPSSMDSIRVHTSGIQTQWLIQMPGPIPKGKAVFCLLHSMKTCTGKTTSIDKSLEFINSAPVTKGTVYINEILYNPISGGGDFIELFNATDMYLTLKGIHAYDLHEDKVQHRMLQDPSIIKPFEHLVFTKDTTILFASYANSYHEHCYNLNPFFSLHDKGGRLLLTSLQDTLDDVLYGDFLQNPLNSNPEGIALEKINPYMSVFYPGNWTSSASWASPGYENSQFYSESHSSKAFHCDPCHITANVNGLNDFILLHLTTNSNHSHGNISIFSLSGEKVTEVCSNQLLASENIFQWNGQHSAKISVPDGIYVAVAEWWLPDGQKYVSKIPISTSAY